jgi:hypothetical protein
MHRPEEQLAEHRHSGVIVERDYRVSWQEQDNHLPCQCKDIGKVKGGFLYIKIELGALTRLLLRTEKFGHL